MAVKPDESGQKPMLMMDDQGNYTLDGGELLWTYLDNLTNLVTALPADYNGR